MNCTHIEKILPLYAGGDLGGKDERDVAAHLRSCENCRLVAEGYRRSQEILHSYEAPEFSSAFFEGIRSAVLEEHARATAKHLTLFQRARAFIKESLPDAQLLSPRVVGFASLFVAMTLALILFNAQSRRQASESAHMVETLPAAVATGGGSEPDRRAALSNPSGDRKPAEPKPETSEVRKVERTLTATLRPDERRRTTRLSARREGTTVERPGKLFKDEVLPGEETYLDAISKLDKVIKSGDGAMSATLRAEYERNLTDVDRAIASTRKAALRHRNDPEMTDFVFAAYRGKVGLLSQVAQQSQSTFAEF